MGRAQSQVRIEGQAPRIALLAHDSRKQELFGLLRGFLPELKQSRLVATEAIGSLCAQKLGLPVQLLLFGREGWVDHVVDLVARGGWTR